MPKAPYLALADTLRERIDEGVYLPGEALPSLATIASEFGVSRSTAAKAVRLLVSEGRLVSVPSWRIFVAES